MGSEYDDLMNLPTACQILRSGLADKRTSRDQQSVQSHDGNICCDRAQPREPTWCELRSREEDTQGLMFQVNCRFVQQEAVLLKQVGAVGLARPHLWFRASGESAEIAHVHKMCEFGQATVHTSLMVRGSEKQR